MRWVRYEHGDTISYGKLDGETILQYDGAPFFGATATGARATLQEVQLLPPVIPPTFYAAGINYRRHVINAIARGLPTKIPTQADIGYRANNALIGPDAAIVVPAQSSGKLQYEGELVAVIGRIARHVAADDALDYVFGYTIGNDVSERSWQASDRTFWRSKNSDTFKPMGPWIETEVDLESLVTSVRLNGTEVSRFKTNEMIFGVATWISVITRHVTLYPGDVIWMGTDDPTLDMRPGDVVEVTIDGIGTLRNPVVGEMPQAIGH